MELVSQQRKLTQQSRLISGVLQYDITNIWFPFIKYINRASGLTPPGHQDYLGTLYVYELYYIA